MEGVTVPTALPFDRSGVWTWLDGSPVKFSAWIGDEPNNAKGVEHYLATFQDGWNDMRKDGEYPPNPKYHVVGFICEWKNR